MRLMTRFVCTVFPPADGFPPGVVRLAGTLGLLWCAIAAPVEQGTPDAGAQVGCIS